MSRHPFQNATVAPPVSAPAGGPFDRKPKAAPATERQIAFLRSLLADRDYDSATLEREAPMVEKALADERTTFLVSKEVASAAIRYLKTCPYQTQATQNAPAAVEDGSYAVEFDGRLRFFHVRTPKSGRWEGYTFVDEKAGPETYPVRNAIRRARILDAIASDPDALARYGQELGICARCHRELTDEASRAAGLGPTCRTK